MISYEPRRVPDDRFICEVEGLYSVTDELARVDCGSNGAVNRCARGALRNPRAAGSRRDGRSLLTHATASSNARFGGNPTQVTTLDGAVTSDAHSYPQFLPQGEHFLYLHLTGTPTVAGVYMGIRCTVDSSARERQDGPSC